MIWNWDYALLLTPHLLRGLAVTIEAVAGGMALALVLGLVLALARRSSSPVLSRSVGFGIQFIRSTPLLVQLYFVFYVLPDIGIKLSALPVGILTLGIHYSCYLAEVYRAGIEGVPRPQWEAATALNFSRWQTYRYIVLPQAIPPVIPVLGNYAIAMFKDTPILSAITVLEIFNQAKIIGNETGRYLEPFTIVGAVYLILSLTTGLAVSWLDRRLRIDRG